MVINNEVYSLISRGIVLVKDLDVVVLLGFGLWWVFIGLIVINVFGGGGGFDGFG